PEGDARDHVAVLIEELEKLHILFELLPLNLFGNAVLVGIELGQLVAVLATLGPPATSLDDIDVELGNDDLESQLPQLIECLTNLRNRIVAELEMALHAVSIHGSALPLQLG